MRLHSRRQELVRYMVSATHQEYLDYPLNHMQSAETHNPMASVTLVHRVQSVSHYLTHTGSLCPIRVISHLGFEDQVSESGMLGPAFTLLVTSTAATRMDIEANDWPETAHRQVSWGGRIEIVSLSQSFLQSCRLRAAIRKASRETRMRRLDGGGATHKWRRGETLRARVCLIPL